NVLRQHCHAAGRDYNEIEKTTATILDLGDNPRDGLGRFLDHLRELAGLGIDHAIISPRQPWDDATIEAVIAILSDIHAIPTPPASPPSRPGRRPGPGTQA